MMEDELQEQRISYERKKLQAERASARVPFTVFVKRTLLPPSGGVKRVLHCHLQSSTEDDVLLVMDSSLQWWRHNRSWQGRAEQRPAAAAAQAEPEDGEAEDSEDLDDGSELPLVQRDHCNIRDVISSADVLTTTESRDIVVLGLASGELLFLQCQPCSPPSASLQITGRVKVSERTTGSLRRAANQHLRVCSSASALIVASLPGDIALVRVSSHGGGDNTQEEKANEEKSMELEDGSDGGSGVHGTQAALLQVDGLVLAVDVLPPRAPSSVAVSSSQLPFRALVGYSRDGASHAMPGREAQRQRLLLLDWDAASKPAQRDIAVPCDDSERIQSASAVQLPSSSSSSSSSSHPLAVVLTTSRALLLSSAFTFTQSLPLPLDASLLACSVWTDTSTLLCAFGIGALHLLRIAASSPAAANDKAERGNVGAEALSWQPAGSAHGPCSQLLSLPLAGRDERLLIAAGDVSDGSVYWTAGALDGRQRLVQRLSCSAPMWDVDVTDSLDGINPQWQLFAACGIGQHSSLRVVTSGAGVQHHSTSGPDFSLLRSLLPLKLRPSCPHHLLVVCCFLSSTRVLSLSQQLTDVTDESRLISQQRTVTAGFALDGRVLLQVTAAGVRAVRVNPAGDSSALQLLSGCELCGDWDAEQLGGAGRRVAHGSVQHDRLLLSFLPDHAVVLYSLSAHQASSPSSPLRLAVTAIGRVQLDADISCLAVWGNAAFPSAPSLCAVGTYASAVQVFALCSASSAGAAAFTPLQSVRRLPADASNDSDGIAGSAAVADSLAFACTASSPPTAAVSLPSVLAVGLRDGRLAQFSLDWQPSTGSASASMSLSLSPSPAISRLGVLPVQLWAMQSELHPCCLLALSGRAWLLQPSPLSQPQLTSTLLTDAASYSLLVSFSSASLSASSLLAVADGRLHVLSLCAPPPAAPSCCASLLSFPRLPSHASIIPLRHTPRRLLFHPPSRCVLLAMESGRRSILCLVQTRGGAGEMADAGAAASCQLELEEQEKATCLCNFDSGCDGVWLAAGTRLCGERQATAAGSSSSRGSRRARGRLLLLRVVSGRLQLVGSTVLRDEVRSVCPFRLHFLLLSCGSSLQLHLVPVTAATGQAAVRCRLRCVLELECQSQVMAVDAQQDAVTVSLQRHGVGLLSVSTEAMMAEQPMLRTLKLQLTRVDPLPRTARQVLCLTSTAALPAVLQRQPEHAGRASSAGSSSVAVLHILAADDGGRVVVLRDDPLAGRRQQPASALPPSAASSPSSLPASSPRCPPLLETEASCDMHGDVTARMRRVRLPAGLQPPLLCCSSEPLQSLSASCLLSSLTGRVMSLSPARADAAALQLLLAFQVHLLSRAELRAEATAKLEVGVLDCDLLLSYWQLDSQSRQRLIQGWAAATEPQLIQALHTLSLCRYLLTLQGL